MSNHDTDDDNDDEPLLLYDLDSFKMIDRLDDCPNNSSVTAYLPRCFFAGKRLTQFPVVH